MDGGSDFPCSGFGGDVDSGGFGEGLARFFTTNCWRIRFDVGFSNRIGNAFLVLPNLALVAPEHCGVWVVRFFAYTMQSRILSDQHLSR